MVPSGTFVPLLCAYTLVAYLSIYAIEILHDISAWN